MPSSFHAMYKESGNSSNSELLISANNNFMNFISDSVPVSGKLNLVQKFIIHNNIHKIYHLLILKQVDLVVIHNQAMNNPQSYQDSHSSSGSSGSPIVVSVSVAP